jgi:hypothetical protein
VCQGEPAALSDDQVMADEAYAPTPGGGHPIRRRLNDQALLIAGRSCRDALKRVCEWHKARGAKDLDCTAAALRVEIKALARRFGQGSKVFHFDPSAPRRVTPPKHGYKVGNLAEIRRC